LSNTFDLLQLARKGDANRAIADYRRQLALVPNDQSRKEALKHLGASP